ncbi:MAG: hypothetical protein H7831_16090 [Magnetococcus sp. WYHC-3]
MKVSRFTWVRLIGMLVGVVLLWPGSGDAGQGTLTIKYLGATGGSLQTLAFSVDQPSGVTLGNCTVLDSTPVFSSFDNGTAGFAWDGGSGVSTVSLGRCDVTYTTAPQSSAFSLTLTEAGG